MKKRLLISLTLGLGLLLGSWLAVVGMAQPVSSPPPPALEGPGFPPTTAGQPIGTPSAGVSINDVALSTVILGPIKDNTLYEPSGDVSSGAGGYLKAGIKCPDTRRRGVIAFDVAGSIPAGSTVVSATLQLSMTRRSCRYVPHPSISIHRLLADWG